MTTTQFAVPRSHLALLPWTIALATGLEYFDNAIFPFFISHLARGLQAAPDQLIWASSAYTAAAILGVLGQQWWLDHFGYRRYFTGSLLLFAIGSLACACSASPIELAIGRGLQGYFIGPLMGACRIYLKVAVTREKQAFATRLFVFFILASSAIAPLAGGYLIAWFGWRLLFGSSAVLAVLIALLAFNTVAETRLPSGAERTHPHVGPYLMFGLAQGALQIGFQQLRFESIPAFHSALLLITGAAALLCWFVLQQWRHPQPLLRLHALRENAFRTAMLIFVLFYMMNTALNYLVFGVLEQNLSYPVERAGSLAGLAALAMLPAMFLYFRYAPHIALKKWLIVPGFIIAVLIAVCLGSMSDRDSPWMLALPLCARGLLLFFIALPVANVAFGSFSDDEFSHSYRFKNIIKQMANSFATAAIIMFEQHRFAAHYTALKQAAGPTVADGLVLTLDHQAHIVSLMESCWIVAVVAAAGGAFAVFQKRIR